MNRISDLSGPTRRLYRRGSDSYINLSVYAFGLAGLWISINTVLLQLRVLEFAAEDKKNGILGGIALVGLVVAAISQPLIGALSDRTTSRWGKRLPYIVVGNVCLLAVVPLLGLVNSFVSGMLEQPQAMWPRATCFWVQLPPPFERKRKFKERNKSFCKKIQNWNEFYFR